MVTIVHLFPHVEVVVGSSVELERYPPYPVEHQVGPEHVRDVSESPRRVALNARDDAEEYLEGNNEHYMDCPSS